MSPSEPTFHSRPEQVDAAVIYDPGGYREDIVQGHASLKNTATVDRQTSTIEDRDVAIKEGKDLCTPLLKEGERDSFWNGDGITERLAR